MDLTAHTRLFEWSDKEKKNPLIIKNQRIFQNISSNSEAAC